MPLLDQAGRYLAVPKEWGISETRNGLPQLVMTLLIQHYWNESSGEWEDISDNAFTITAYLVLGKKDGSPNEVQILAIRDALGWDGQSLETLGNSDWSGARVQLTVVEEVFEGVRRVKVAWINPEDWDGGGIRKLDVQEVRALDAQWGAKIRAVAGPALTKPSAKPSPPARTPQPSPDVRAAKARLWKRFREANPNDPPPHLATLKAVRDAVEARFPGRGLEDLNAVDMEALEGDATDDVPF